MTLGPWNVYTMSASTASLYPNNGTGHWEEHLFFVGVNGSLMHSWWDGIDSNTYAWNTEQLTTNSPPGSDPIVMPMQIQDGTYELHIFFRGSDGSLQHVWYDGSSWFPETIAGTSVAVPPADMNGHNSGRALGGSNSYTYQPYGQPPIPHQHVFYSGTDGSLYDRYWDGTAWSTQPALPGPIAGPPAAQAAVFDTEVTPQVNVFFVGTDGSLHLTMSQDNVTWNTESVPSYLLKPAPFANPAAAQGSRMDVFYRAASHDGYGLQRGWSADGSQWDNVQEADFLWSDPVLCTDDLNQKDRAFYLGGEQILGSYVNFVDNTVSSETLPGAALRLLGVTEFDQGSNIGPHIFFLAADGTLAQAYGNEGSWNIKTIAPANTVASYSYWPPSGGGNGPPGGCGGKVAAFTYKLRQRLARSGSQR